MLIGTFIVNFTGCLVLGILSGLLYERFAASESLRAFLLIGLLGGYTTFSTFAVESLALIEDGSWGLAALNVVGSPVLGILGAWLGIAMVRALPV